MATQTSDLIFRNLQGEAYEKIVEIRSESTGLHAIIAIHNTVQGPALGGIRAFPYSNFNEALTDVKRLAKGMTYKSALAQSGTGGGKSVIITKGLKTEQQLLAFAEAVNYFEGQYICAEDVGMSPEELAIVRKGTRFAVGLPHPQSSGDPSPFTARGGYRGIQAVCKKIWKDPSVRGKSIAIQGLGSVGMKLAHFLFWEGADLIVSDIDQDRVRRAVKEFGAKAVDPEDILFTSCDILAPCALGGILNPQTIPQLKCKAVAGLANNQLLNEEDGYALWEKGILYAPDFAINAGGLINVCVELEENGYQSSIAEKGVSRLYNVLLEIFQLAEEKNLPTHQVAKERAEQNLRHSSPAKQKHFHH
jgi:leucine dehydrogenase